MVISTWLLRPGFGTPAWRTKLSTNAYIRDQGLRSVHPGLNNFGYLWMLRHKIAWLSWRKDWWRLVRFWHKNNVVTFRKLLVRLGFKQKTKTSSLMDKSPVCVFLKVFMLLSKLAQCKFKMLIISIQESIEWDSFEHSLLYVKLFMWRSKNRFVSATMQ